VHSLLAYGYARQVSAFPFSLLISPAAELLLLLYSIWQCYVYYVIGSLSNDISKLAHIAGFYKGIQSAGASVAYDQDHRLQPYMTNLAVTWSLCGAGLLFAIPLLLYRVTDSTPVESEVTVPGREEEIKAANEVRYDLDAKVSEA